MSDWERELQEKHECNIERQKDIKNRPFPFSYKYFENRDCEFWPCHGYSKEQGHNCLFCRCPLFQVENCIGIQNGDGTILENGVKDCTNCRINHDYDKANEMSRA